MSRTKAQALLAELQRYTNALILGDKPDAVEQVRGVVDGGPAMLVEIVSAVHGRSGGVMSKASVLPTIRRPRSG